MSKGMKKKDIWLVKEDKCIKERKKLMYFPKWNKKIGIKKNKYKNKQTNKQSNNNIFKSTVLCWEPTCWNLKKNSWRLFLEDFLLQLSKWVQLTVVNPQNYPSSILVVYE